MDFLISSNLNMLNKYYLRIEIFLGLRSSNSMQGCMFSCEIAIFHALLKLAPHSLACTTMPMLTITIKHAAKSIIDA